MAYTDTSSTQCKIARQCLNCDESFYAWPSEVEKGWAKFCKQACHYAYRAKLAVEKFWAKVNKTPGQGPQGKCWQWTGYTREFGHGGLTRNGRNDRAHRFSYTLHYGDIPDDLCVLHKCDNPPCVRPEHLFLGTKGDNNKDRNLKDRSRKPRSSSLLLG